MLPVEGVLHSLSVGYLWHRAISMHQRWARGRRRSRTTNICDRIKAQVYRVAQLPAYSAILQHWVHGLAISRNGGSLEVLDILADAQGFSSEAELLLDGFVRGDDSRRVIRSEEVPGVEAREVLEGTEELIATD